ncbi:MAG: Putative lipoprotein thiredoxin [uncultured Sulfurovum sp.]|uniref:Lipoprotein thiredoxin n=1 Tax=uncultured Sulfurovum sp. TaxID=269237 RepID=A0A6S6S158_9BACT|nr:MAG: Putative lipoprotein thiredoxin [uncultured Sulfurovum sp.]
MKNKFYLILVLLSFLLSACGENTNQTGDDSKLNAQNNTTDKIKTSKSLPSIKYHFEFENSKKQANILDIKDDKYTFKNIKQPIVIITVMATWCPPCRGQIPHLSKLQQKFKENVFVMSTLIHDDISIEKLDKFIIAQKMLFYVSTNQKENLRFTEMITPKLGLDKDFPMPLTLVFVRGKYFTHYEGMIPEEMIESDIKQLLEKIKK